MLFAQVAVPSPLSLLTYRIPEELKQSILPGYRILVPFRRQKRIGFVFEVSDKLPEGVPIEKIKTVEGVVDKIFSGEMLRFLTWLADYYMAPIGEVCRTALPSRLLDAKTQKPPRPRRKEETHLHFHQAMRPELTQEQKKALETILKLKTDSLAKQQQEGRQKPILLHGITGSGKTEIYLRIIEELLTSGKEAILLVPEIGLTPQLIGRVQSRLQGDVAIYHSGLTDAWRHLYWERIRCSEVKVAVGTRSALFAPFQNLGAIIVDEEHDPSFKQTEGGFYYHARDAAIMRGKIEKAPVILGSATPSLETIYNCQKEKYDYIRLSERATGATLPTVEIIDLRQEKFAEGSQTISPSLKEAIHETLYREEQVILFLNRRGFANFLLCEDCGHVSGCPDCDISLTYHKRPSRLTCHYCDFQIFPPEICANCGSRALKLLGQGTELLEEELKQFFPLARIARLDRDTASNKNHRHNVLKEMKEEKIDILIGTQIVAKGHDFPNVTLVGITLADTSLNIPDFRSSERTFQLLSQAAGRAGRADKPGKVLIQTFYPEHFSLLSAKEHNFDSFLIQELKYRKELHYPPYTRLAQVRIQGPSVKLVSETAEALKKYLAASGGALKPDQLIILGPAPSPLSKLKGKHRYQFLIKSHNRSLLEHFLNATRRFEKGQKLKKIKIQIDIDSLNLM